MYVMSGLAVVMFFGLTYVANALGSASYAHPSDFDASQPGYQSVVAIVADRAWPPALHLMFYVVQVSTAIVLLLAANTAFAGFPQLASMMARDNFLPRQLANMGDRLAYSNGIVILALVACALIIIFRGLVDALLPMYAIGVFIGFTLAQAGMVLPLAAAAHAGLAEIALLQCPGRAGDRAGGPDHRRLQVRQRGRDQPGLPLRARTTRTTASGSCWRWCRSWSCCS